MAAPFGGADEQNQTAWKRAAAAAAVAAIPEDCVLGLGSGTTAELMLEALAARVRQGLRVTGVATSERTHALAVASGIPLLALDDAPALDMSIDGADEVVLPALHVVKGHGGALLREKLVAAASRQRVIIVDDTKVVSALGERDPIPVEVIVFGWTHTARRLAALGLRPERRMLPEDAAMNPPAHPFVTDTGNYILDCATGAIADPTALALAIKAQLGVVEHGLFVGMTERVYIGGAGGVQVRKTGQ
jgi:ribose 5-phosphate isomerase A